MAPAAPGLAAGAFAWATASSKRAARPRDASDSGAVAGSGASTVPFNRSIIVGSPGPDCPRSVEHHSRDQQRIIAMLHIRNRAADRARLARRGCNRNHGALILRPQSVADAPHRL